MKGWKSVSSGTVSIVDEERPNPIHFLKQFRDMNSSNKKEAKQQELSWRVRNNGEAALSRSKAPPNAAGRQEAFAKMAALASMGSMEINGLNDLEAAKCIKCLMEDPSVSVEVMVLWGANSNKKKVKGVCVYFQFCCHVPNICFSKGI